MGVYHKGRGSTATLAELRYLMSVMTVLKKAIFSFKCQVSYIDFHKSSYRDPCRYKLKTYIIKDYFNFSFALLAHLCS